MENIEDGECVQLFGKETIITTSINNEIDANPSASNKVQQHTVHVRLVFQAYDLGRGASRTEFLIFFRIVSNLLNQLHLLNSKQ